MNKSDLKWSDLNEAVWREIISSEIIFKKNSLKCRNFNWSNLMKINFKWSDFIRIKLKWSDCLSLYNSGGWYMAFSIENKSGSTQLTWSWAVAELGKIKTLGRVNVWVVEMKLTSWGWAGPSSATNWYLTVLWLNSSFLALASCS